MQIAIIALGSRGDVQPYVALGKGLREAGHAVRLLTHQNFEELVTSHGLEFWPARGNVQDVAESEEMKQLLEKGNFIAITRYTAQQAEGAALHWAEDGLAACQGVDLIIAGLGGMFIGIALAEKLGIPMLQAYLVPFTATKEFPGPLVPQGLARLGGVFNRLSYRLIRQLMWLGFRSADSLSRRKVLDLPSAPFTGPYDSISTKGLPVLYGFSPSVITAPSDWPKDAYVTGFWFLDSAENWTPPSDLVDFLQAGPPPLYIGFGSMSNRKPEETADLVLQALSNTGQRAILLSGWGGLQKADLPASILMIDSVPHAWLFPRVAAVVHHGGAGTTAAGLRAGVPSIVIPFFADQPFWGHTVAKLGVGPSPIPRQKLTVERLTQAIQETISNQNMHQCAADLGAKIRSENGIGRAVEVIQQLNIKK
jgi:UDP:flavonoid glycosyltransferase YjiC (YdhE family)